MYEFTSACRDFRTHSCFHCATEAAREVSKLATWCGFAPTLSHPSADIRYPRAPAALSVLIWSHLINASRQHWIKTSDRARYPVCAKHFHHYHHHHHLLLHLLLLLSASVRCYYAMCRPSLVPLTPLAPYSCISPHFAQWINQAEWWGTRHIAFVYMYSIHTDVCDEARRNSVASIYCNKRDVKQGGQMRGDIHRYIENYANRVWGSVYQLLKAEWLVTIRLARLRLMR